ncbi:MAG TPA: hypothetical protein VFG14_17125, partial [Chthoniobacteraceae bacterium]|nr:hypothetical protein [Chthoniobacteraceae bacterium]
GVPLGRGFEMATWPAGNYHLEITEAPVRGGELPPQLHVGWHSWATNPHGKFIVLANLLLWLGLFDLWRHNRHRFRKPSLSWMAVIAGACCLLVLTDILHPLPFLHEVGQFPATAVE